jgi:hypothetical protein
MSDEMNIQKKHGYREDDRGIRTTAEASLYISRYLEPALIHAVGGVRKIIGPRRIGSGRFYRFAEKVTRDRVTQQYSVTGDKEARGPQKFEITVCESHPMSDIEIITEWPVIATTGLSKQLQQDVHKMFNDDFDPFNEEYDYDDPEIDMMIGANQMVAAEQADNTAIYDFIYGEEILKYFQKTLKLVEGQRPQVVFEAGYEYDDETYEIKLDDPSDALVGSSPDELVAVNKLREAMLREISSELLREFEEALLILGIIKKLKG